MRHYTSIQKSSILGRLTGRKWHSEILKLLATILFLLERIMVNQVDIILGDE